MKLDILSKTTLKLTLTAEDMDKHSLRYETLSEEGSSCRQAIGNLIDCCGKPESDAAARLLREGNRLFVEAFRRMDGGCMLYVSALDRKSRDRSEGILSGEEDVSPIIFEAASEEDLGTACRSLLYLRGRGAEFSSSLFYDNSRYRLALIPQNTCVKQICRSLHEFGEVYCDELIAAFTCEYFRLLAKEMGAEIAAAMF